MPPSIYTESSAVCACVRPVIEAVDRRHLDRLLQRERRQDGRQAAREHRLAGARRADEEEARIDNEHPAPPCGAVHYRSDEEETRIDNEHLASAREGGPRRA